MCDAEYPQLIELASELGCLLLGSGAEIYRAEDSVTRLLAAYGVERPQVFAIPSCLIVSALDGAGTPVTRMRRLAGGSVDIDLLEKANALCRRLCADTPPAGEAMALVTALKTGHRPYGRGLRLLGYGLAPAFFTLMFGGSAPDALCACLCGLAVGVCLLWGRSRLGRNAFFHTVLCSAVAAALAMALVRLSLGRSGDTITIGTLMLLVPGVALTNAMRDIMGGDTYSGISRLAEALLIAAAIALGTALGLAVVGLLGPEPEGALPGTGSGVLSVYLLPCLWAFCACVGFTLIFNLRGRLGKAICGLGGALGWLVYLLLGQTVAAAFAAALVIGVFSELMARLRHFPATSYLLIALLPLVPGGGIYYTMTYCLAGDIPLFLSKLLQTLGMAAALAVGATLALTVFRAFWPRRHR